MKSSNDRKWLIVGYGSTLRGDDAAGVRVAEAFARLDLPGVRAVPVHQLMPEMAEELSHVERAVFVDAAREVPDVTVDLLIPDDVAPPGVMAHHITPSSLLRMAGLLYNHAPPAWMIRIPAKDFESHDAMTPETQAAVRIAIERVLAMISAECTGL